MGAEFQPAATLRMFKGGKAEKLRPEAASPAGTTSALVLCVRPGGHTFIRRRLFDGGGKELNPMAKRRAAARVALTDAQRERLERLWFVYVRHASVRLE